MSEQVSVDAMPVANCPICGCPVSIPTFVKYDYTIARCTACDTLHVSPIPSDELLRAHYQDPQYFDGHAKQGYRDYTEMRKALAPHFGRRLRTIDNHLSSRGRLLDFGCAAGYFLEMARDGGWQIAGVELSQEMARSASQVLGISIASSLDALPAQGFDAITLWEVVEHLPQPVAELRRLRERLRPGGLMMLSTPNTGHWQAVREPEAWPGYRPPSHLVFFTRCTLEDALRRSGFERIAVHTTSPLPPLPRWLRRLSASLQQGLASGQARSWQAALYTWRAVRVFGWAWQKIAYPDDDIFATLEATAFRPM